MAVSLDYFDSTKRNERLEKQIAYKRFHISDEQQEKEKRINNDAENKAKEDRNDSNKTKLIDHNSVEWRCPEIDWNAELKEGIEFIKVNNLEVKDIPLEVKQHIELCLIMLGRNLTVPVALGVSIYDATDTIDNSTLKLIDKLENGTRGNCADAHWEKLVHSKGFKAFLRKVIKNNAISLIKSAANKACVGNVNGSKLPNSDDEEYDVSRHLKNNKRPFEDLVINKQDAISYVKDLDRESVRRLFAAMVLASDYSYTDVARLITQYGVKDSYELVLNNLKDNECYSNCFKYDNRLEKFYNNKTQNQIVNSLSALGVAFVESFSATHDLSEYVNPVHNY